MEKDKDSEDDEDDDETTRLLSGNTMIIAIPYNFVVLYHSILITFVM